MKQSIPFLIIMTALRRDWSDNNLEMYCTDLRNQDAAISEFSLVIE